LDWKTIIPAAIGSAVPGLIVAIIVLVLTYRTNRSLEKYRKELDKKLQMFGVWHGKRLGALIDIYEGFRQYLDFLRKHLYFPTAGGDVTPMHDFRNLLDRKLVFLDDELASRINNLSAELLMFWNWAQTRRDEGEEGLLEVRNRLDYDIPSYLDKLRRIINEYAIEGTQESMGHK
jgi:hypothetical protein